MRGYDEARALAERSIALVDGVQATRAARPRTIASGECVVVEGTRASGGASDTLLYVFNFADDAGFSIIAADASTDPLIAVTEKGRYVYGEATGVEPFDAYMAQAISSVTPPGSGPDIPLIPDPRPRYYEIEYDTDVTVGPLLQTKWGQTGVFVFDHAPDNIYGHYCKNKIAGCTATAMAQLMAYYAFPSSIQLSVAMGDSYWNGTQVELNWDGMLAHRSAFYPCRCSEVAHEHIGVLMREIGQRVAMDYKDTDASGSTNKLIGSAFRSFGYEVPDTLRTESPHSVFVCLAARMPVLVCGVDLHTPEKKGHTWLADGYAKYKCGVETYEWVKDLPSAPELDGGVVELLQGWYRLIHSTVVEREMLHFNWGDHGRCDGYFRCGVYKNHDAYTYDEPDLPMAEAGNYDREVRFLLNVKPKNKS